MRLKEPLLGCLGLLQGVEERGMSSVRGAPLPCLGTQCQPRRPGASCVPEDNEMGSSSTQVRCVLAP